MKNLINVRVKLLGTLSSCCRIPCPAAGLDLELPVDTTVADLVKGLGIEKERVAIVTINGFLAKADDRVPDNATVKLIQPISGG